MQSMNRLPGSTVASSFSASVSSPLKITVVASPQKAPSASSKRKAIQISNEQGGDKCGRSEEEKKLDENRRRPCEHFG